MSALLESILAAAVCQMCELEKVTLVSHHLLFYSRAVKFEICAIKEKAADTRFIMHIVKALKMLSNETRYSEAQWGTMLIR